ncbi:MAG: FAD/NAD(P)-binding oxidoreductase [Bacteroidota bacterium]
MSQRTIVVLGGGVGGLVVANDLRRRLPDHHRVVLVEKNPEHAFAPSFLWLMTGDRKPEKITRPLHTLVRDGVQIINAEVVRIDIPHRSIATSTETLTFDYLVIALGADLAPETVPGLVEIAHSFYTLAGAKQLQRELAGFTGGKIALVVSSLPYKCPGAPHEGAMLVADYLDRSGIRDKVDIDLYTPETQPMPVAGPQVGDAVKQMLDSTGVAFHPLHKLVSVNPQTREINFEGKAPVPFDLLIAIPPHRAPSVVRDAGLTNESGWIPVDRFTLKTRDENVYAIGDIAALSILGRWKPEVPMMLPKAGVFAHDQAQIVAERITGEIRGLTPRAEFCGAGYCMLEAGEGLAGFAFGDFFGEPSPRLQLRQIGRVWHFGKVLFERWWLSPFGMRRAMLRHIINIGSRLLKIPVKA